MPETSQSARGRRKARFPGRLAPDLILLLQSKVSEFREGLSGRFSRGLTRVSLAAFVMASFSPRCEIRQLAVFVFPGGIKAPDAERHVVFYGRRARPVKKPRFIPAQLAYHLARKLQAKRLGTMAVL